jgi:hypothetical protein
MMYNRSYSTRLTVCWPSWVQDKRRHCFQPSGLIKSNIFSFYCPPRPPKKVRFEPGSDRFRPPVHSLNLDPDLGFGSMISLNFGPNLGPVLVGSGSNRGSEPNIGITNRKQIHRGYLRGKRGTLASTNHFPAFRHES